MSTGDQSQYMRAKMAERGTSEGVQFMRDGFDKWAESTAPARAGQVEKMPAETQMANTGGAMTPSQARKYAQQYAKKAVDKAREMAIESYNGGAMCGGRSVSIAGLNFEIPDVVEKAMEYGEKVLNFALLVKDKLPEIEEAIQDEIIDNERDPSITATDRKIAKEFLPLIKSLKPYLTTLEKIKQFADTIKKALGGSGRGGSMRGGATAAENFKAAVDFLQKAYIKVKSYIDFITKYGRFIIQMLKISALQPIGKEILEKIKPILSLVGITGGRRKQTCECSDSEEYHGPSRKPMRGGFFPGMENMFGQQKQEATMMPMQGNYGMMQSGYKGSPMYEDGGMQMGDYGMMGGPMKYESTYEPAYEPSPVREIMDSPSPSGKEGQIKALKQKLNSIQKAKIPREEKEQIVMELEKQLKELTMRGGMELREFVPPNNEELIKKIKAEINRLKNMRQDGARATATKRRIETLESQLQRLMMTGGRTSYVPTYSSSRKREPNDSVVTSRPVGGRKPSARGEIVKKVMREKGLSLPQASKYVKENNLY